MLRQTAFGIALSTLVIASGYMTAAKQTGRYQRSSQFALLRIAAEACIALLLFMTVAFFE